MRRIVLGIALLLSGCNSLLVMQTYEYQVEDETYAWRCTSKWVGIIQSFPSGRIEICEEVAK